MSPTEFIDPDTLIEIDDSFEIVEEIKSDVTEKVSHHEISEDLEISVEIEDDLEILVENEDDLEISVEMKDDLEIDFVSKGQKFEEKSIEPEIEREEERQKCSKVNIELESKIVDDHWVIIFTKYYEKDERNEMISKTLPEDSYNIIPRDNPAQQFKSDFDLIHLSGDVQSGIKKLRELTEVKVSTFSKFETFFMKNG